MSTTYESFSIEQVGSGFQKMSNVAGKVASFWVVSEKKGIRSMFVVARSLTDSLLRSDQKEDQILTEFNSIIRQYIDDGKIVDLEEYPFQYVNGGFILDENAAWWVKTLRRHLSPKT